MRILNIHSSPSDPYPVLTSTLESKLFGTGTACEDGA